MYNLNESIAEHKQTEKYGAAALALKKNEVLKVHGEPRMRKVPDTTLAKCKNRAHLLAHHRWGLHGRVRHQKMNIQQD